MTIRRLLAALTGPALAVGTLAGCGSTPSPSGEDRVQVAAAFYALEYAAQRIGGERVEVSGLTKPGVEPHDVELSAKRVGAVALADLVLHFRGFQPAVDEAVDEQAEGAVLDVRGAARPLAGEPHGHEGETAQEHQAHADEPHTDERPADGPHTEEPHADEAVDPHFWLDPHRYADVARAISTELQRVDPAHAADYRARTEAFTADLDTLDHELEEGLAGCRSRELVTSHAAFGYLAQAYDLHQEGITGLSPEAEPSPAALARVAHVVRDEGVRTIYAETMVSRDVADTLARETGARVRVLDPIEGLTDESAGDDYLEVMRANLATLRDGQDCR